MENEKTAKFNELINQMVDEQTLSSSAFKRLSELREEHEISIKEIEELERQAEVTNKTHVDAVEIFQEQIGELIAREVKQDELDQREKTLLEQEQDFELRKARFEVEEKHQVTRANTAIDMFKTVFANVTVRRGVNNQITKTDNHHIPGGNHGPNGDWVNDRNEDHTVTETEVREDVETVE